MKPEKQSAPVKGRAQSSRIKLPPKRDTSPVLLGIRSKLGGQFHVWCPHCRKFHHHGYAEGHRAAHCFDDNSPFRETGYHIADGTRKLARMVQEAAE
jgi:hypothetical protein